MRLLALTSNQCIEVLSQNRLGHLGCVRNGQPYVVPINYIFADNCIYSFAMAGQKIEWMRASPLVCLQVEVATGSRQWRSVIVTGRFEELSAGEDGGHKLKRAWSLLSRHVNWWEPATFSIAARIAEETPSHVFYRIAIEKMSGRQVIGEIAADPATRRLPGLRASERLQVAVSNMRMQLRSMDLQKKRSGLLRRFRAFSQRANFS